MSILPTYQLNTEQNKNMQKGMLQSPLTYDFKGRYFVKMLDGSLYTGLGRKKYAHCVLGKYAYRQNFH